MTTLFSVFASTGFVGILLFLVAVVGAVSFLRRVFELRLSVMAPPLLRRSLEPLLTNGEIQRALDVAAGSGTYLGRIVCGALLMHGTGEDEMLANLERVASRETLQRANRVAQLVRLGVMAILLGFLGTTIALISAADVLKAVAAPTPAQFTSAIGDSLPSCAFGLFFALLLFGAFFSLDHHLTRRGLATIGIAEEMIREVLRPGPSGRAA